MPSLPLSSFSWGDLDGDGLPDALVLTPGQPARLLRNDGRGAFFDDGARAGLPELRGVTAALWQDVDGDARADLLMLGPALQSRLLLNLVGETLRDASATSGLGDEGVSAARFLDLDGDERPDLELTGLGRDRLLRNLGGGRFEELQAELPERALVGGLAPAVDSEVGLSGRPAEATGEETAGRTREGERERVAERPAGAGSAGASVGAALGGATPGGSAGRAAAAQFCAPTLLDVATGSCVSASSLPTLGQLYPLSSDFNLDAAGRIGVGTTTPSHRLTIQSAGSDDLLRLVGSQGGFGHGARLNLGDGDFVHLWEYDDDRLEIRGDKEVLLSANSGEVNVAATRFNVSTLSGAHFLGANVGIGTSSPLWPLHLSATQAVVRLDTTTHALGSVLELRNQALGPAGLGAINFVDGAGQYRGQVAYLGNDALTLKTAEAERLRIDSSGRVGIGTSSPQMPLHVNATQAVARLETTASTNGAVVELRNQVAGPTYVGALNFVNSAGQVNGQIAYTGSDALLLRAGGAERVRVSSAGYVGIGKSTPSSRLDVTGSGAGIAGATTRSENTSTGSGIAVYGTTRGTDTTAVFTQTGSGPILRGFNGPESGGTLVFEVRHSGRVVTTALEITGGGDLVESFDTGGEVCEPGSVLVIDPERAGELKLAREPYDRRVAGVVSGAGGVNPGIELAQRGALEGGTKVALTGRVWVRCSAENGPIEPGDLLTTAALAGHAMKACNPERAFGAVIGKAMTSLENGQGLVLVLVNLQ